MYSRTKPTVYIVHWPERGIIKAGYSERQRWRPFIIRGAKVVDLIEFKTSTEAFDFESLVLEMFDRCCSRAFAAASEAVEILGGSGGGHLECYTIPPGVTPVDLLRGTDWRAEVSPA